MRRIVTAMAVAAVCVSLTSVRAQDSKAALDAAARALGDVTSIQFSGTGTTNSYGQSFKPDGPWPAFKTTSYTVTVDYKIPAMRMELQRTNPDVKVVRGGGGLPLLGPQTQHQVVSGKVAWNVAAPAVGGAPAAAPAMAAVNDRLLAIWAGGSAGAAAWVSAPQGVIKAAQANNATVAGRVVTFTVNGTSVKATLNAANLVEKVEAKADAPVLGDVVIETTYANYRDFGGVKFPARIAQKEGGFPMLDLTITDVRPNVSAAIAVPQNVQQAAAQPPAPVPVRVQTDKVADGVYYLTGGSHHSLAVEFADHVVVFEAPQTDERAMAVLDAARKANPNKPIRYVVNSHHHFDHLGGVRAIMAEGITIITQAQNEAYYGKIATMLHTIIPDRLSRSPKKPVIETVAEKRVLTDGAQVLELYHVPTDHADTMLVGYLPKARILIEADLWNPPAANAAAPATVNPVTAAFFDTIQRMKLDVNKIAGLHGRLADFKEFQAAVGRATH
jgi:glyoxylase-like metal-dependent hydrolase (beta-lactamase superfamily II)